MPLGERWHRDRSGQQRSRARARIVARGRKQQAASKRGTRSQTLIRNSSFLLPSCQVPVALALPASLATPTAVIASRTEILLRAVLSVVDMRSQVSALPVCIAVQVLCSCVDPEERQVDLPDVTETLPFLSDDMSRSFDFSASSSTALGFSACRHVGIAPADSSCRFIFDDICGVRRRISIRIFFGSLVHASLRVD